MTIESTIASLLEESRKLQEANEVVPTRGTPEPSNAKNNVGDEKEGKGGTSKKANRATQGALPAETMRKLQAEAYDELSDDEIDLIESIDDETFEQLDELSKATLGSYIKKSSSNMASATRAAGVEAGARGPNRYARMDAKEKRAEKRGIGISKAVSRLTREDFDLTEDVAALFNGEDGLTEEFRQKAETIFEAAVTSRIKEEVAHIEEAYNEAFEDAVNEAIEEEVEGLVEHVDGYLNLMVEQWMKDNEVALESGMKSDILESFVGGLKNLFQEHYIEVPEDKFDLTAALEEQVEILNAKLDEAVTMNVEMRKALTEGARAEIISEVSEGLTDLEAEKLHALAEEIVFEDVDSYARKLSVIKENYFTKKSTAATKQHSFLVEDSTPITEEKAVPAEMRAYVNTISTLIR